MSQQVNFYHPKFRPVKRVFPAWVMLSGLIGVLLLCGAVYGYGVVGLRQIKQELAVIQMQEGRLKADIKLQTDRLNGMTADPELTRQADLLEQRLADMVTVEGLIKGGVLGSGAGFSVWFRSLASAAQPGAWLTAIRVNGTDDSLSLDGRVLASESMTAYLQALRRQREFVGVQFSALDLRQPSASPAAGTPDAKGATETPPLRPAYLEFSLKAQGLNASRGERAAEQGG